MNQKYENLSATLDGNTDPQSILAALDDMDSHEDCAQAWVRYALIGEAMRDPAVSSRNLTMDVSKGVMQALVNEPVPTPLNNETSVVPLLARRFAKPDWEMLVKAVSSSLAAVAAIGFVSVAVWTSSPVARDPVSANAIFEQPVAAVRQVSADSMPPELNEYLLAHRQNSAAGSMNVGAAVIKAGNADSVGEIRRQSKPKSDMAWVRLWDSEPVYVKDNAREQ
ncbi:MAG: sigma-E factor negative regulatory protein [Burkholderiales bacterium]|jgi:negative regulator of sigma E activity|nr:sigma-E factor negative regulatory protein [Burkholderiales bacterium]